MAEQFDEILDDSSGRSSEGEDTAKVHLQICW